MGPYEILPGGDIIFSTLNDECFYLASPGEKDYKCVIDESYKELKYTSTYMIGLSPDRRRLAFKRRYGFKSDLFILELIYD